MAAPAEARAAQAARALRACEREVAGLLGAVRHLRPPLPPRVHRSALLHASPGGEPDRGVSSSWGRQRTCKGAW